MLKNFAFEHEGEEWWWSRSVACASLLYAADEDGDLCILANKRGPGAPTNVGKWNCPCGYVDCGEGLPNCAAREVFEETGVEVHPDNLILVRIDDAPHGVRQNITAMFIGALGSTSAYTFSKEHMESNEVDEIKFIKLKDIDNYEWAFGHGDTIRAYACAGLLYQFNLNGKPIVELSHSVGSYVPVFSSRQKRERK